MCVTSSPISLLTLHASDIFNVYNLYSNNVYTDYSIYNTFHIQYIYIIQSVRLFWIYHSQLGNDPILAFVTNGDTTPLHKMQRELGCKDFVKTLQRHVKIVKCRTLGCTDVFAGWNWCVSWMFRGVHLEILKSYLQYPQILYENLLRKSRCIPL